MPQNNPIELSPQAGTAQPAPDQLEQLAQRLAEETELDPGQVESAIEIAFRQTYQGPFPPPQIVEQFNAIRPDLGTRLIEDHLERQKHDRALDWEDVSRGREESRREDEASNRADRTLRLSQGSVIASYVLLFFLVWSALLLAFHGHAELAGVFLAAPLITVVGSLIPWGKKDREIKKK